jgi:hypothetical protein
MILVADGHRQGIGTKLPELGKPYLSKSIDVSLKIGRYISQIVARHTHLVMLRS